MTQVEKTVPTERHEALNAALELRSYYGPCAGFGLRSRAADRKFTEARKAAGDKFLREHFEAVMSALAKPAQWEL